jgi:hypothetical protein
MKRMSILGLFVGAFLFISYQPPAAAMPVIDPGLANFDGAVVTKAAVARRVARRTTRRTARRVHRRY